MSYYFSPFRWKRRDDEGNWRAVTPHWSVDEFLALLPQIRSMTEYLKLGESLYPRLRLLRFENLAVEFRALTRALNLPVEGILPHRYQTADVAGLRRLALSMCSENSPFGVSIITTLASFSVSVALERIFISLPSTSILTR